MMLLVLPEIDVNQIDITSIAPGNTTNDAVVTMQPTITSSYYSGSITRNFRVETINCLPKDEKQKIVIPADGKYQLESWGAQGGSNTLTEKIEGGNGAYTSGEINLLKNQPIYAYVGGRNNQGMDDIQQRN
jgi:hypothetical protein